jgi:hypothetical protein
MADDLSKRGPQDASKISLSEPWEVQYWTSQLGCSEQELRAAVKAVGNGADAVRNFLARR